MKYTCDKCGNPTDNKYVYKDHFDKEIIKRYGWGDKMSHTCDECEQKAEDYEEWKNEQYKEDRIICPWCGYKNEDSWEYVESEDGVECDRCGKLFNLEVDHEITYTTRKSDSEYEGELI